MPYLTYTNDNGQTYEVLMVHKRDHEGSLMLDRRTGAIVTPIMERPEWAEGLTVALLAEHREFYLKRCGTYQEPELFDMADLGWLGMTDDEGTVEIFADTEMRQERLAHLLHVDRETGDIVGALVEVEHAFDQARTDGEVSAIEAEQEAGFGTVKKMGGKGGGKRC